VRLQRSEDPLAVFKGPTSKGREGKRGKEGGERKGREREGKMGGWREGKEGKGRGQPQIFWPRSVPATGD